MRVTKGMLARIAVFFLIILLCAAGALAEDAATVYRLLDETPDITDATRERLLSCAENSGEWRLRYFVLRHTPYGVEAFEASDAGEQSFAGSIVVGSSGEYVFGAGSQAGMQFGFVQANGADAFCSTVEISQLSLHLGQLVVNRTLLIEGRLYAFDGNGLCTVLEEQPDASTLAVYAAAGYPQGIPGSYDFRSLPEGFLGVVHHIGPSASVIARPGCETSGLEQYFCTICGGDETRALPPLGHQWKVTGQAGANCVTPGYETQSCARCGKQKNTSFGIDPYTHTGRTWVSVGREPTCTEPGYTDAVYCADCGAMLSAGGVLPALGHAWDAGAITKAATCVEEGEKTYACSRCGETNTEKLDKNPSSHTGKTEIKNAKDATCTEPGSTGDTYCADCGVQLKAGDAIAALGHAWNEGEITKAATCVDEGEKTYACSRCGETNTEKLDKNPGNHTGKTEIKNAKDAACTEAGYTGDTYCADCGVQLKIGDAIAALGHDWDEGEITKAATCVDEGEKTYTCSRCGETNTEKLDIDSSNHSNIQVLGDMEPTCSRKGYTGDTRCMDCFTLLKASEEIDMLPHDWDEGQIYKDATCVDEGEMLYRCNNCRSGRIEPISQNPDNHTLKLTTKDAEEPTCTEAGYTGDQYCECGALIEKGETIAALGHDWSEPSPNPPATCVVKGIEEKWCLRCNEMVTVELPIDPDAHDGNFTYKPDLGADESVPGIEDSTDYVLVRCNDCGKLLWKRLEAN